MTNKYQNSVRTRDIAEFPRVAPTFDGSVLVFRTKSSVPNIAGVQIPMVRGNVRLTTPAQVTSGDQVANVNESVAIEFNLRRGGANLAVMVTEVKRALDAAVADYQLANGLVPPSEATFEPTGP